MKPSMLALVAAFVVAAPAGAATPRHLEVSVPPAGATRLALEYPIGELDVTESPDSVVHLMVRARCKHDLDDCDDRIRNLTLESRREGATLRLKLLGMEGWKANSRIELRGTLQVPAAMAVKLEVGIGEVSVGELTRDVSVKLGIGEAHVRLHQDRVHSVRIESGIGDASLMVDGRSMRHSGFLGHSLLWQDGHGNSSVEVEVGIGESSVVLN